MGRKIRICYGRFETSSLNLGIKSMVLLCIEKSKPCVIRIMQDQLSFHQPKHWYTCTSLLYVACRFPALMRHSYGHIPLDRPEQRNTARLFEHSVKMRCRRFSNHFRNIERGRKGVPGQFAYNRPPVLLRRTKPIAHVVKIKSKRRTIYA
jgi:hypothetical protein